MAGLGEGLDPLTAIGIIHLLRRQAAVVVIAIVVGATLAICLAKFVLPPTYVATLELYVSGQGSTPNVRVQNGSYAQAHISSYTDMVDSHEILQAARAKLGVPPSHVAGYADLATSITASNPLETSIIKVTVQATSAEQAFSVASAIAQVFNPVVAHLENASSTESPVSVNVLSAPTLPTAPSGPSWLKFGAGGLLAGLAVGAGAAYLIESLSRSKGRRSRAQEALAGWSWDPASPDRDADEHLRGPKSEQETISPIRVLSGHERVTPVVKAQGVDDQRRSAAR